jgi:hypothetical protein
MNEPLQYGFMIALPGTGHKRNRCAALTPSFDAMGRPGGRSLDCVAIFCET